ncbi:hypothetical protein DFR55_10151 [Herbinix hemicellulosilytica]|uniref:Uncharacterized protein n=1 Tax=Herbinix hemicellulosilytica TaxID=1564487 RepID=A0A0H5SFP1_HERHM|nr:NAD(P)/FAD-dependent oxidoreductase [Herbinix hemicellulosilytica]RBP60592.1 hypothetical protein DFR55_10151 [Herbinix hemicellulosilytica]CRZ34279.1 hypothetical protein HHT355_1077 [Herbinix hemicellulosilytica]
MEYDVIIAGAGAAGLVAAIAAARKGKSVLIIEKNTKAGKKILATGNGKCNFTNLHQTPECYRSEDSKFAMKVLSNFDLNKTLNFFENLGIFPKERNGYVYPFSEQASSVVSVLLMECERLKVEISYNEKVKSVIRPDFTVVTVRPDNTEAIYYGKKLIIATGGCASPNLGSDGSGYQLAKSFGHSIVKPLPALVSLKSPDKFCKTVSGVRTQAKVTAYASSKPLSQEEGEIIFTDYGISGIPVMQLSRFVSKALDKKEEVFLILDFFKEYTNDELKKLLTVRCSQNPNKTLEEMLIGLFNNKLNYILIKEAKLDPGLKCKRLSKADINKLAGQIKNFKIRISDTNSFDFAQVTAGGVSTSEINPDTLESKKKKNLYFAGEIVDVDGTCGGYNLQWAWSSGYIAGSNAAK